jgi:hypothetical protein
MKPNQQQPKTVAVIDLMKENYSTLVTLLRSGVSLEDLQYIAPLDEINELRNVPEFQTPAQTTDWTKLNAHICRKYYMTEISIWRAKKRLEREITIEN